MSRRALLVLGVILAVVGLLGLAVGGIPYTEEESFSVGPLEASTEVEREREIPPLLAGLVLAAGAGLVVYGVAGRD